MGFFSKIGDALGGVGDALGGALKNQDLLDGLTAMSMSLDGNEAGAAAMRDNIRNRRDMARVSEIMSREGYGAPTGNVPGELRPMEVQEAVVQRAPLLSLDDRAPSAPVGAANLPAQQVAQPKSLYMAVAPELLRMSQRGQNVQPLVNMLQNEDYVRGLPMQAQAEARAVGPDRYAGWQREDSRPQYIETPTAIVGLDRRVPREIGRVELPQRPEPVTPDRIQGAVIDKYRRGEPLTAQEQQIFDRWRAGSDGFYGERAPQRTTMLERIVAKLDGGQPLGPGEQQYWDAYKRRGTGGIPSLGGEEEEEAPQAKPAAAPPGANGLPQRAAPQAAAPKTPPTHLLQEGRETKFANGQVWTKRGGKAVRLR